MKEINVFYEPSLIIFKQICSPYYLGLVVFLYMLMYKKTTNLFSFIKDVSLSMLVSILINYVAIIMGIYIDINIYLLFLVPIILILSTIKRRYVCLAYAGAIYGVISIFYTRMNVNISQLIGVVGLLHLAESILIMATDDQNIRKDVIYTNGKLKQGYKIDKVWILPFYSIYIMVGYATEILYNYKKKLIQSGIELFIYSLTLIFIYVCAQKLKYMEIVGLVVMPVMHELFILKNRLED